MNKKELFENWYGAGCSDDEKHRMFEMVNGHYKLMQCHDAYGAFCAAMEICEPLEQALVKLRDCDWVITLPDRMDGVRKIARNGLAALNT
ncbi:MAG: hypothetical protein R3E57_02005 [Porticoccaceae bacterium]